MSDPTPPPPPARCTARATTFRPAQGSPESIPNHFNSDGTGHSERAAPRRLRARPATATATTTAQRSHYSKDRFFSTREPRHWSLAQYLDFCRMVCDFEGRRDVVNRYCRLIRNIAACDTANCCSEEHRRRAKALQKQYKRRGAASDKAFARSWMQSARDDTAASTPVGQQHMGPGQTVNLEAAATVNTIHFGNTYYGDAAAAANPLCMPRRPVGETDEDQGTDRGSMLAPDDALNDECDVEDDTDPFTLTTSPSNSDLDHFSTLSPSARFRSSYATLHDSVKWRLNSTGHYVEDILYRALRKAPDTNTSFAVQFGRSFSIDVTNETMRGWFEPEEWAELKAAIPKLPPPPEEFVDSLLRYEAVRSVGELREAARTSYLQEEKYQRDRHWDREWAEAVLIGMHALYDAPNQPLLLKDNAEDFYSTQLWASIIDRCFWNIPGVTVQRSEITCVATAERRNRHRQTVTERSKLGARVDGVVRTISDKTYEFAAFEVGRAQQSSTSTKTLSDSLKLAKVLRDMLRRLHELVDNEEDPTGENIEVPGILTMGLQLQVLRVLRPRGSRYVCLLTREKPENVPSDVAHLSDLLHLLVRVLSAKELVRSCVEYVNKRRLSEAGRLRRELLNGRKASGTSMPWTADSPPPASSSTASTR